MTRTVVRATASKTSSSDRRKPNAVSAPRRRIGVMIDCTWAYGRGLLRGVVAYGIEKGWRFHRRVVWMGEPSTEIPEWDVEGIVVTAFSPDVEAAIQTLRVPVVNVAGLDHEHPTPSVAVDDAKIAQLAVQHFVERGFTRLAIVTRFQSSWSERRRVAFVRLAMEQGLHLDQFVEICALEHMAFPSPSPELNAFLQSLQAPVGVFCVDDSLAESVLESAEECGRRVPEELAVLGVANDALIVNMTSPPLSSVEIPAQRIGYEAANLLETLMSGKAPPAYKIFVPPHRVVVRQSTDLVAMSDPDVSTAVAYIRDHAMVPISVSDVVNNASLSRRPLEKRFRKVLGRSILDEIHRAHIERAKELLSSTELSIQQIATACGFSNNTRFGVTFRKSTQLSPSEYRAKHHVGLDRC